MNLLAGLVIAYLAGSFPTASLVGRAKGVDLGSKGSGNYGATNVFRTLGPGPATVAVVVDVGKGLVPVLVVPGWLPVEGLALSTHAVLIAVAAVLGHVFSVWLAFRGGKGIATAFGAFLGLAPWAVLIAAFVWVGSLMWRRIVSVASLSAAATLLVALVALRADTLARDWPLIAVTAALVAFVFWTHRENIGRIRRGEEKPIRAGGRT